MYPTPKYKLRSVLMTLKSDMPILYFDKWLLNKLLSTLIKSIVAKEYAYSVAELVAIQKIKLKI